MEKENELIELQLQKALRTQPVPEPRQVSNPSTKALEEVERLSQESQQLQLRLDRLGADLNNSNLALERAQQQLADVTAERDQLKLRQAEASKNAESDTVKTLRDENARLSHDLAAIKKEFDSLKVRADNSTEIASLRSERDALRKQVQSLDRAGDQRDVIEELMRENALLKRQNSTVVPSKGEDGDA